MISSAVMERPRRGWAVWAIIAVVVLCLVGLVVSGLAAFVDWIDGASGLVPTAHGPPLTGPVWRASMFLFGVALGAVALCGILARKLVLARRRLEQALVAEARAQTSQAQLKEAIEASPEGFAIFDRDNRLIHFNDAYRRMRPEAAEPMQPAARILDGPKPAIEAGAREDRDAGAADRAGPASGETSRNGSHEQQLPDGRWVRVDERQTRDGGHVSLYVDITTAKQRETELAEKTRLLQATLEHMGEGLSVFDKSLRLIAWNDRFIEILQLARHFGRVGAPLRDILAYQASRGHFGKVDVETEVTRRLALVCEPRPRVKQRRMVDGRMLELRRNPMPGGGFVTLYADITERTRAEGALRASEERFKDFAEASSDWFWEMGPDLRFTHVGERIKQVSGLDPSHFIGHRRDEFAPESIDPQSLKKHMADLAARRPFRDFRYAIRDPNGAVRHIVTSGKPVYTVDGIFLGYRGIARDITDQVEAEERADLAQSRLVAAIEGLSDGIALFDKDDRLVICNGAALRMLGSIADILVPGVSFEAILRENVRRGHFDLGENDAEAYIQRRLAQHRNPTGPFERRLSSGRWEQLREQRLSDGGLVSLITDVTDVMERNRLLGVKTELLQTTLENMGEGISVHDRELRFVTWNDRCLDLMNLRRDIVHPGLTLEAWIGELARQGETGVERFGAELRRRLVVGGDGTAFEWPMASGRIIEVRCNDMPDGGLVTLYADVTKRRRAEEALRRSEQKLLLHAEQTPLGVIEWDLELRVTAWNAAAERIFGFSKAEAMGRRGADLLIPSSVRPQVDAVWNELLTKRGGARSTNENVTKSGETIVCDWYNTPLVDRDGEVIGVASLVEDITDRIRTEAMLREAKEAAEMNNRAKSNFLANMSHELRTPLNAIIGFSEMISGAIIGPVGNPKYIEYARDIWDAGNHLLEIINDILDLAKVEAGKLEINEEILDVAELIQACLRVVQGRVTEKSLSTAVDVAVDLPGLLADARSLKQILLNLLTNAIKFTPNGGHVRIAASFDRDGAIVLSVSDSGIGMKPEDIPRALSPFMQIGSHLNREYEGTGLGLPLSKTLAEIHGGTLEIESEPEVGTTVRVRFPANRTARERSEARMSDVNILDLPKTSHG